MGFFPVSLAIIVPVCIVYLKVAERRATLQSLPLPPKRPDTPTPIGVAAAADAQVCYKQEFRQLLPRRVGQNAERCP